MLIRSETACKDYFIQNTQIFRFTHQINSNFYKYVRTLKIHNYGVDAI